MQGHGARREQLGADGVADVEPRRGVVHGLLQARGGDRRRSRKGHERLGRAGRRGLLGQQRDDAGDRRGLARPGATGDDREAMAHGRRGGHPLALVGLAREEPRQPFGEHVLAHVMRRRRS